MDRLEVGGRRKFKSNASVAGAKISFKREAAPAIHAVSDPTGIFNTTLPGPGAYSVEVDREGYFRLVGWPETYNPRMNVLLAGFRVSTCFG